MTFLSVATFGTTIYEPFIHQKQWQVHIESWFCIFVGHLQWQKEEDDFSFLSSLDETRTYDLLKAYTVYTSACFFTLL